jgi:hypothetical protein
LTEFKDSLPPDVRERPAAFEAFAEKLKLHIRESGPKKDDGTPIAVRDSKSAKGLVSVDPDTNRKYEAIVKALQRADKALFDVTRDDPTWAELVEALANKITSKHNGESLKFVRAVERKIEASI